MAVIGVVAILLLATQSTSADTIPVCPDNSGGCVQAKFSLRDGATTIAAAMAGFETGTLAGFDPNSSVAWQGQAQRNNNPGNLRGVNGVMQKFATPSAGFLAMINDIANKIQGRTATGLGPASSISDLVNVWAPVGSENPQGSVGNYIGFVSGQVGAALGTSDITMSAPSGDIYTVSVSLAPFNSYIEV